ncbi:MAG: polysaccharide deacetylase [Salinarimonadaceae bacterium]|nr:MAG: polysaccharide deacetylase [Salinarimonadaceae bacterium]
MSLKSAIIRTGLQAIDLLRADVWLRPLAQGRGVILMFHHVRPAKAGEYAPNALLEITPEFLDETLGLARDAGFDFVSLDEVPARLAEPAGRPFAALTFDDGYRDNAEYALPVLRRHGAPAAIFVTTGFADGDGRLWWLELEEAIARLDRVEFVHDGEHVRLPATDAASKAQAFEAIYWRLRGAGEGELLRVIAELAAGAGIDSPALTRSLCMDWDEIGAMAQDPLVTIGAHTCTHPMLAKHDDATARREIFESKRIIEGRLGREARHFSYPVGDRTSAGPRDFSLAREAGFATAVTTRPGHVFAGHAAFPHALPRVSVNGLHQNRSMIRALLSGAPFLLWNAGRRVNAA